MDLLYFSFWETFQLFRKWLYKISFCEDNSVEQAFLLRILLQSDIKAFVFLSVTGFFTQRFCCIHTPMESILDLFLSFLWYTHNPMLVVFEQISQSFHLFSNDISSALKYFKRINPIYTQQSSKYHPHHFKYTLQTQDSTTFEILELDTHTQWVETPNCHIPGVSCMKEGQNRIKELFAYAARVEMRTTPFMHPCEFNIMRVDGIWKMKSPPA